MAAEYWYSFLPIWTVSFILRDLYNLRPLVWLLILMKCVLYNAIFVKMSLDIKPCSFYFTWSRICLARLNWYLKFLKHSEHWYSFKSEWTVQCVSRWDLWEKDFEHFEHWYSFSPVWIRTCLSRHNWYLKFIEHSGHLYGLSFEWTVICNVKCEFLENTFMHTEHWYGFSPEWTLIFLAIGPFMWKNLDIILLELVFFFIQLGRFILSLINTD